MFALATTALAALMMTTSANATWAPPVLSDGTIEWLDACGAVDPPIGWTCVSENGRAKIVQVKVGVDVVDWCKYGLGPNCYIDEYERYRDPFDPFDLLEEFVTQLPRTIPSVRGSHLK